MVLGVPIFKHFMVGSKIYFRTYLYFRTYQAYVDFLAILGWRITLTSVGSLLII